MALERRSSKNNTSHKTHPRQSDPDETEAIVQIMLQALAATDLTSYLSTTLARVVNLIGVDACSLHADEEDSRLSLKATSLNEPHGVGGEGFAGRRTLPARARRENGPIRANDLAANDSYERDCTHNGPNPASGMSTTIHTRTGIYGTLTVYSTEHREFEPSDIGVLQDLSNTIGHVVDRERDRKKLIEERGRDNLLARTARERYEWLSDVANILACANGKTDALKTAATLAIGKISDYCAVDIVEINETRSIKRVAVAARNGGSGTETRMATSYPVDPLGTHGTPRALRTGQSQLIADLAEIHLPSTDEQKPYFDAVIGDGACSYMCVPLQVGYRVVGAMCFLRSSTAGEECVRYTQEDLVLAEGLARCAALALGHGLDSGREVDDAMSKVVKSPTDVISPLAKPLTGRQTEILLLMDQHMTYPQIAEELHISFSTVKKHTAIILKATAAHDRREAVNRAKLLGLLDNSPS